MRLLNERIASSCRARIKCVPVSEWVSVSTICLQHLAIHLCRIGYGDIRGTHPMCVYYVFTSHSWAILHEMFTSFHVFCSIIARNECVIFASCVNSNWIFFFFQLSSRCSDSCENRIFRRKNKKSLWRFTIHTEQYLCDDHLSPQHILMDAFKIKLKFNTRS